MKKIVNYCLLTVLLIINLNASCLNKNPDQTIEKALHAIERHDYRAIRSLIGTELISDTSMFGIVAKVNKVSYFLDKYHRGSVKGLEIKHDTVTDDLGRDVYIIPVYAGYDSVTGLSNVRIILNVGPFSLFPPDKLTGFAVERDVDVQRRSFLRDNEIYTYDFDSANYSEYKKLGR